MVGGVGKALQKSNLFIKDLEAIADFLKHFQLCWLQNHNLHHYTSNPDATHFLNH